MTTGAEPVVTGTTLLEIEKAQPSLDLEGAVDGGIRSLRLTTPCRLSADAPIDTLALVRLLREAAADGVSVEWQGQCSDGIETDLLVHLPPPSPMAGAPMDPGIMDWRERHRAGLCYYRLGPEFVFVKDVRRPSAAARFRLEGADVVRGFRVLEGVVEIVALDPSTRELLESLEAESLALRLGEFATLLPNRMRHWPVPSQDV